MLSTANHHTPALERVRALQERIREKERRVQSGLSHLLECPMVGRKPQPSSKFLRLSSDPVQRVVHFSVNPSIAVACTACFWIAEFIGTLGHLVVKKNYPKCFQWVSDHEAGETRNEVGGPFATTETWKALAKVVCELRKVDQEVQLRMQARRTAVSGMEEASRQHRDAQRQAIQAFSSRHLSDEALVELVSEGGPDEIRCYLSRLTSSARQQLGHEALDKLRSLHLTAVGLQEAEKDDQHFGKQLELDMMDLLLVERRFAMLIGITAAQVKSDRLERLGWWPPPCVQAEW